MPHNSRSFLPANGFPSSWKMQIFMNLAIPAPDGAHYNVFEELCIPFVLFRTNFSASRVLFSFVLSDDLPVFFGIRAINTFISVNISCQPKRVLEESSFVELKIENNGCRNIILISMYFYSKFFFARNLNLQFQTNFYVLHVWDRKKNMMRLSWIRNSQFYTKFNV